MYNFLLDNNLLYKYQSGILPHHSTVFQLTDIFHNIYQAFDNIIICFLALCSVMCQRHLIESGIRVLYLSYGKMALKETFRMVKQLSKSKKTESWSKVLVFMLRGCRRGLFLDLFYLWYTQMV